MTTPTWDDLTREYTSDEKIGVHWLSEVERAVGRVAVKYPPAVYSETGTWDANALENLVQDVVLTQLLDQGQLDYILTVATSIDSARALLTRTVKRTLGRGRRRTVVDNLLDRAGDIAPFAPDDHSGPQATDAALTAAANLIAKVPRVRIINSDRAPMVYTTENLYKVVELAATEVGPNLRRRELEKIFQLVLSDYVPSALVQFEGDLDEPDRAFTPEQEHTLQEVVSDLQSLPEATLTILALKIADHSDEVVGDHLDISRPTAAKRFKEASRTVSAAIGELTPSLQDAVLARFADFLLTEKLPHDPPGGTQ
jgi:hypothetical protein